MNSWSRSLRSCLLVCLLVLGFGGGNGITTAQAQFDWQRSEGPWGGAIFSLAEALNGDLYAGSWRYGGIFRSADGGATWQLSGLWGQRIPEIVVDGAGTIFVIAGGSSVYRSEDNGTSWQLSGSSLTGSYGGLAYDDVLDILGDEHLRSEHRDVMLEAATTSFQIHLKTPAALAHRFYNASIMMTAPILAAAANAPFLFGKSLWHETRIPVFEQSIALTDLQRIMAEMIGERLGKPVLVGRYVDITDSYHIYGAYFEEIQERFLRNVQERSFEQRTWRSDNPIIQAGIQRGREQIENES